MEPENRSFCWTRIRGEPASDIVFLLGGGTRITRPVPGRPGCERSGLSIGLMEEKSYRLGKGADQVVWLARGLHRAFPLPERLEQWLGQGAGTRCPLQSTPALLKVL